MYRFVVVLSFSGLSYKQFILFFPSSKKKKKKKRRIKGQQGCRCICWVHSTSRTCESYGTTAETPILRIRDTQLPSMWRKRKRSCGRHGILLLCKTWDCSFLVSLLLEMKGLPIAWSPRSFIFFFILFFFYAFSP